MGKLSVTIVDVTGQKEQKADVPDDQPIRRIIQKLITMMKLPVSSPDGQTQSYKFIHKSTGKELDEAKTLKDEGVKDGDVLRMQPEITAA